MLVTGALPLSPQLRPVPFTQKTRGSWSEIHANLDLSHHDKRILINLAHVQGDGPRARTNALSAMMVMLLLIVGMLLLLSPCDCNMPIVVFRGLNDSCCQGRAKKLVDALHRYLPSSAFIYSVRLHNDPYLDRLSSVFGNALDQVDQVCEQLGTVPELSNGFIGIGLSQGGLLLRAYVERCPRPVLIKLITLGSPHVGVDTVPRCGSKDAKELTQEIKTTLDLLVRMVPDRLLCGILRRLILRALNSTFFQTFIIPAQYFLITNSSSSSSSSSSSARTRSLSSPPFLATVNNEPPWPFNQTYKERLANLSLFVSYRFDRDELILPPYSPWFSRAERGAFNLSQEEIYQEDWIGLRQLNETGRLQLRTLPDGHMQWPADFVPRELLPLLTA